MNIVRKDLDQSNAILTLQIEKADYAEKVAKSLREYSKKANIPGFRPGKIPAGLVQKMYGKAMVAEEVNKMVSEELYKYINDNKINLLGEPLPNETEQQALDFNTQENFEIKFDIGLAPEFDVQLSTKDNIDFYNIAVSDEMIENQVKSYTSRYGKYIQEEVVEANDMLKGELLELADGKVNESGINVTDAVLTPSVIADEAIKAQFVGATKGTVIIFNPSKAFENEAEISSLLKISKDEVKNVDADFQFTIQGITRYHESEIDQEFFDKIYEPGTVSSEEEFRAKIKANIEENLISDSDYKFGVDAQKALLEKYNNLVFPDAFLKRWVLATNKNLTKETLEEDFPKMIEDLKWQLIKNKIVKKFEIKVENEDVEEYAKKITKAQFAQYGMVGMDDEMISNYAKEMLKKEETLKGIVDRVIDNKVYNTVKQVVTINTKDVTIEEFNKFFEN